MDNVRARVGRRKRTVCGGTARFRAHEEIPQGGETWRGILRVPGARIRQISAGSHSGFHFLTVDAFCADWVEEGWFLALLEPMLTKSTTYRVGRLLLDRATIRRKRHGALHRLSTKCRPYWESHLPMSRGGGIQFVSNSSLRSRKSPLKSMDSQNRASRHRSHLLTWRQIWLKSATCAL